MKKLLFVFIFFTSILNSAQHAFLVYFQKPNSWGTAIPKIHIFGSPQVPDTSWPGQNMETTCSENWFVYKAPAGTSFINFVINNGNSGTGNQTQDLTASGTVYFMYNSAATTNPAFVSPENPMIPNPCLKINRDSGTWMTGTLVPVTVESFNYIDSTIPSTIYYTQDGTEPNTTSSSTNGTLNLSYSSGSNTLKAYAVSGTDVSATQTRTYNFTNQGIRVNLIIDNSSGNYNSWLINAPKIHYWGVQTSTGNPTISDSTWPGIPMYNYATNSYYYFFPYATSVNVVFNNGSGQQTPDITNITQEIWYQYPSNTLSTTNILSNKKSVQIYPNPVRESLNIISSETIQKIEILDVSGKIISTETKIKTLSTNHLLPGTYFLKVTKSNSGFEIIKFIKK